MDEDEVLDAIVGRRIVISREYMRSGKPRRKMLCKGESEYLTVICEPANDFWWILSAFPGNESDARRARAARVGEEENG